MFIEADITAVQVYPRWDRPSDALVQRFAGVPAANAADVFDRLLVMDSSIKPVTAHARLLGTAFPVLTRAGDNLAVHRALDEVEEGDVLVVAGQGDRTRALIGDLIGEIMIVRGVKGAVVDGAVRDAEQLDAQGLSVFARAITPAGPFKQGPGVVGTAVACGGVVVQPGDLVVADADGVSIVPAARLSWAAERVQVIINKEAELRRRILASRVSRG